MLMGKLQKIFQAMCPLKKRGGEFANIIMQRVKTKQKHLFGRMCLNTTKCFVENVCL